MNLMSHVSRHKDTYFSLINDLKFICKAFQMLSIGLYQETQYIAQFMECNEHLST